MNAAPVKLCTFVLLISVILSPGQLTAQTPPNPDLPPLPEPALAVPTSAPPSESYAQETVAPWTGPTTSSREALYASDSQNYSSTLSGEGGTRNTYPVQNVEVQGRAFCESSYASYAYGMSSEQERIFCPPSGTQPVIVDDPCLTGTGSEFSFSRMNSGIVTDGLLVDTALLYRRPTLSSVTDPAVIYHYTQPRVKEAQIWMWFPHGTNPSVAVNFNEYPGQGDFRIFRTDIPRGQSRKYYIKAFGKGHVELGTGSSKISKDSELAQYPYVTLRGGDTVKLAFAAPPNPPPHPQNDAPPAPEVDVQQELAKVKEQLEAANKSLEELKQARPCEPFPKVQFKEGTTLTAHVLRENNQEDGKITSLVFPQDPMPQPIILEVSNWCPNLKTPDYTSTLELTLNEKDSDGLFKPLEPATVLSIDLPKPATFLITLDYKTSDPLKDYFGITSKLQAKSVNKEVFINARITITSQDGKTNMLFVVAEPIILKLDLKSP